VVSSTVYFLTVDLFISLSLKILFILGTCTNINKVQNLRKEGIDAYLFDGEVGPMIEQQASSSLIQSSFIVSTIPPMGNQNLDPVLEHHAIDLRRAALTSTLKWIGYLSSTGVYGDRSGAWVTEEDSLRPDNDKTKARVVAENNWKSLYVIYSN